MPSETRYLCNPDVSCREEGPGEGAILFNPDTDAVLVINAVGLLIWQALAEPRTTAGLVDHLLAACEEVPADQVEADVSAFVQGLLPGGFVAVAPGNIGAPGSSGAPESDGGR
jgi:hypothetical protein